MERTIEDTIAACGKNARAVTDFPQPPPFCFSNSREFEKEPSSIYQWRGSLH